MPIARSTWFTAPNSPLSRTNHRIATATPDRTAGTYRSVRKMCMPRSFWLSSSATASPATMKSGVTSRTHVNVTRTDVQKAGSLPRMVA